MRFLGLSIENFGVFRGKHSFELAPRFQNGQMQHLTIFSGHNGAGKTTIFQAMMLALYGQAYFGDTVSPKKYNEFVLSRMHHAPDKIPIIGDSSVALSFQYIRSGQFFDIYIERRWKKHGRAMQETLTVLQDNQPPDVEPDDYQTWIDDFIPPGIGKLCFFDAEQLDSLANQDQQSNILGETLTRLLGLDLVLRLEGDLDQLMNRQGSTKKIDQLYAKLLECQSERDELDVQLVQIRRNLEEVESDISNCEEALAKQERLLASEGGTYAARRPLLQDQLKVIEKEVEALSNQLRDLSNDLLPFALAPELCLRLYRKLTSEDKIYHQQAINRLLQEKIPELEQWLSDDDMWKEQSISLEQRRYFTQRLVEKLKSFGGLSPQYDANIIHHLSEPEQQKVLRWILQVIREVPQQVQYLGGKLRTLKEEQRRIETDLQRAPNDSILAPIHAEITRLRGNLTEKRRRKDALNERIGSLQFQRNEKHRTLEDVVEDYNKMRKFEKQLIYAQSSKNVLRTYKDALIHQRLKDLEKALVDCFNKICRKEHLLSEIQINPESFAIQLKSVEGILLEIGDLSAGERQLYAMSLLWALRIVSRLPLPIVIDTPLARLDEIHRLRFIRDYIPSVSDQVLLFTTDAELDAKMLSETKQYLAFIYRLNHDSKLGETLVTSDVTFVPEDMHSNTLISEKVNIHGI